jgi:hypothetical protein
VRLSGATRRFVLTDYFEPIRSILRADHQVMAEKGYLDREAPSFDGILRCLERLEVALRAT